MNGINPLDILFDREINIDRDRIYSSFNKSIDKLEKYLAVVNGIVSFSKKNEYLDDYTAWNLASFVVTSSYDLKISGKEFLVTTNSYQKRYFARQIYLTIWESMNKIPQMMAKIKSTIEKLKDKETITSDLKLINKKISEFKEEHKTKIKTIRNNTIGHRDSDTIRNFEIINAIDSRETWIILTTYSRILDELMANLQNITDLILKEI